MSDALTPEAPETDPAAPSVEDNAPGDGTAVAEGSAGDSDEWKRRFDGLMASSQKRESELRTQLVALEARINQPQETPDVADDAILAKLEALEERAVRAERETAIAKALVQYPDAAPFADLFVGTSPEDIENVAAAVAQRAAMLKGPGEPPAPVAEGEAPPAIAPGDAPAPAPAAEAPVIGGGAAAPAPPSTSDAVKAALEAGSWSDYWTAKSGPIAAANLG